MDVCLKHAVHDDYSGADFPAGPQRLNAEQALAFVRQRHGLENGDLDRTHRQQAFLLSVSRELQQSGSFTDLDKFKRLMDVARQDIVLSQGWGGEDQFRRMAALAGGDVEFRTLPVVRYDTINGQDVNIVDPAKIRAEIARAIGGDSAAVTTTAAPQPLPPPNPHTVVSIVNASDTSGLASQAASLLGKHEFTISEVRDRESGEPIDTVITYAPGAQTDAQSVATLLGVDNAPAGHRSSGRRPHSGGSRPGLRHSAGAAADRGHRRDLHGPQLVGDDDHAHSGPGRSDRRRQGALRELRLVPSRLTWVPCASESSGWETWARAWPRI